MSADEYSVEGETGKGAFGKSKIQIINKNVDNANLKTIDQDLDSVKGAGAGRYGQQTFNTQTTVGSHMINNNLAAQA